MKPETLFGIFIILTCSFVTSRILYKLYNSAKKDFEELNRYYSRFLSHEESIDWVKEVIENEGLHSAIINYEFRNVKDEKFHELRVKYIDSHNNLVKYLEIEE